MEPEMVAFLKRIGKSITIVFCWLAITTTAAVKGDNAFVAEQITIGNVLFYMWVVVSLIMLGILFKKIWFKRV